MTVNDISRELGITKRAIKFYEEKGLLSVPKDRNGYRSYSEEHIKTLKAISVYRRLGISLEDIKGILNQEDDAILLKVLKEKEAQLREKQAELLELQALISSKGMDRAYESLEYESLAEAIKEAFPGFYGQYLFNHFLPYLQIRLQTEEQRAAYSAIKEFWDNTEIKIPMLLRLAIGLKLKLQPQKTPEQLEKEAAKKLKLYLNPTPEEYESLKKAVLEGYRTQHRLRLHPVYTAQRRFMRELQSKGYNDIFISSMKKLSPPYKAYHEAFTSMNDRICKDLGLYYDAAYNLVRKEQPNA